MHDKIYYDEILNLKLPHTPLDKVKYDKKDGFCKYFSLDLINKALDEYLANRIDKRYLADWANRYNHLLNCGFRNTKKRPFDIAALIEYEISDTLDSLSFFDTLGKKKDIAYYRIIFSMFSYLWKKRTNLTCLCTQLPCNKDYCKYLLIDKDTKVYYASQTDYDINYELELGTMRLPLLPYKKFARRLNCVKKKYVRLKV